MFYENHKELVIKIIEHAVKDWRILEEKRENDFCDQDHENICKGKWECGHEELVAFFTSPWFNHICDNLGIVSESIRNELRVTQSNTRRIQKDNPATV